MGARGRVEEGDGGIRLAFVTGCIVEGGEMAQAKGEAVVLITDKARMIVRF